MWLFLTLLSYFLFAGGVIIIDKYFLEKPLPDPRVLTFYTAFGGIIFLFVAPFILQFPKSNILALNFVSGRVFIAVALSLYKSFKLDDISNIISAIGALTAVFIYFFNYFFFEKVFKFFAFGAGLNEKIVYFSNFKTLGLFF